VANEWGRGSHPLSVLSQRLKLQLNDEVRDGEMDGELVKVMCEMKRMEPLQTRQLGDCFELPP
jgi:hypothetical protein